MVDEIALSAAVANGLAAMTPFETMGLLAMAARASSLQQCWLQGAPEWCKGFPLLGLMRPW